MTWILSMHDYKQRQLPTVGYLKASSGRSDSDCVNRAHLADVLHARRRFDNHETHPSGGVHPGPLPPRADAAPDLPAASIPHRIDSFWLELSDKEARFLTLVILLTVFCAAEVVML